MEGEEEQCDGHHAHDRLDAGGEMPARGRTNPTVATRARRNYKCHSATAEVGGRRRRDVTNAVRLRGHDRNKPYSGFHRFEKVGVSFMGHTGVLAAIGDRKRGMITALFPAR